MFPLIVNKVLSKGFALIGKMHGYRKRILELFALALSLQFITIIIPLFTQWMIDSVIPSNDKQLLVILMTAFAAFFLLKLTLDVLTTWGGVVLAAQLELQWSTKLKWHLLELPMKWFGLHDVGDIISRYQSIAAVQSMMSAGIINLVINLIFLILSSVVMLSYSLGLASIAAGATLIYIAVRVVSFKKLRNLSHSQLVLDGETQTTFIENIQCIETIKTACIEDIRIKRWVDRYKKSIENSIALKKYGIIFGGVHGVVEGGETILILGVGASLVIDGNLTLGMLMAFIAYKAEFTSRAQKFIDGMVDFSMLKIHIDRISGIAANFREDTFGSKTISRDILTEEIKNLQIINLYYRYTDAGPWLIENLNITISAGEHVVVTGITGCGKSTLVKIILGLVEPTSGEVRINDISMKEYGLTIWRSKFSAVLQGDQLFAGTVSENICLSQNIDYDKMKNAARDAQISGEIEGFEGGYEALVQGKGANISGGQKQRIMIARALYRNAPILVLDEATSHLDEATEKKLNIALAKTTRTVVSIAHRAETISSGSRIFCMKRE